MLWVTRTSKKIMPWIWTSSRLAIWATMILKDTLLILTKWSKVPHPTHPRCLLKPLEDTWKLPSSRAVVDSPSAATQRSMGQIRPCFSSRACTVIATWALLSEAWLTPLRTPSISPTTNYSTKQSSKRCERNSATCKSNTLRRCRTSNPVIFAYLRVQAHSNSKTT